MSVWHDLFLSQYHPGSLACTASGLHTLHSLPNIPSMTAGKEKKWCTADLLPAEICYCTKRQVRYSHKVSHTQRLPFIDATSHFGGRRQETLGSFSCLWHVFGRRTWTESFVLKYVGSELIHHLKRTLTAWTLRMPCLLNRNLHRATFKRSFSFSGRNRMRAILWGERWRGDSWEGVFSYNRKRKLLPACITKCLQWAFWKTEFEPKDSWNFPSGISAFLSVTTNRKHK